jgi:hypothetical protein
MNPLIELRKITSLSVIVLLLACLGLPQRAQAVSPPPDGAYFGANTAEGGAGALGSLTTGTNNTALGSQALSSLTTGIQNTATGAQALRFNTADQNTADGFQALNKNTTSSQNTASGWRSGLPTRIAPKMAPPASRQVFLCPLGSRLSAYCPYYCYCHLDGSKAFFDFGF